MGEFIEKNYAIIAHPLMISAKLSLCPSVTTCPSVTNDIPIKLKIISVFALSYTKFVRGRIAKLVTQNQKNRMSWIRQPTQIPVQSFI